MTRDYCSINFAGLTHDHSLLGPVAGTASPASEESLNGEPLCSAIAILKRHPMYDCLLLVKKYRKCLEGHSLEFPVDRIRESERLPTNESAHHQSQETPSMPPSAADNLKEDNSSTQEATVTARGGNCGRRRMVTRFLDGDDPVQRDTILAAMRNSSSLSLTSSEQSSSSLPPIGAATYQEDATTTTTPTRDEQLFMGQLDDLGHHCQLVHVPINGLLDRLEGYTRSGIAVDGRVYAFAMGLKTAERMMTTKSMKELQETPI